MSSTKVIWDPKVRISTTWQKRSPYNLEAVTQKIKQLLLDDDDIIQQWLEKEEIEILLNKANSFEKMAKIIRITCGEHEENKDLQKFLTDAIPDFFKKREEE
ncbi:hypothetical protein CIK05_09615 [Bdellovibrio sp. qaytius]|nr:hypothetical protein CIK05_09615 [Bdellovibrio sp. qaytius]